jgi:hypothetical protein
MQRSGVWQYGAAEARGEQLRSSGASAEVAKMQSAFHRTLEKEPPDAATKVVPTPTTRLADLRTLGKYTVTWVKQLRVVWNFKSVPWWAWLGLVCLYAAIVWMRVWTRRKATAGELRILR